MSVLRSYNNLAQPDMCPIFFSLKSLHPIAYQNFSTKDYKGLEFAVNLKASRKLQAREIQVLFFTNCTQQKAGKKP